MSGGFLHANRNKRSVALDLKSCDGREALLKLATGADVLMYNVRPKAMARLGLDYETVSNVNPRIVYCEMCGFAEGGPYSGRPAYDDLIQAVTGMSALMAEVGDGVPRYVPVLLADRATGMAAINALLHRERTGRGQALEITMMEAMVPFVLGDHMNGETFILAVGDMGYKRVLSKSRRAFSTRDGNVAAVVYTDKHWRSFFEACGQPERFKEDVRLHDIAARTRHIDELYEELCTIFPTRSTAEWLVLLEKANIPAAPVHTLRTLLDDPHLKATGFFREEEHAAKEGFAPWRRSVRGLTPRRPYDGRRRGSASTRAKSFGKRGYAESTIEHMIQSGVARAFPAE